MAKQTTDGRKPPQRRAESDKIAGEMKNIRLLEDRIQRVIARLEALANEKKALEAELGQVRAELQSRPADGEEDAWVAERTELVQSLEETLSDLRAGV